MAPAPAETDMCPPAGVALAGKVPGEAGQTEQLIRPRGLFYIGLYMGRRQQPWVSVDSAEAHAAAWTPGSRLRLCSGRSVTRSTCEVCGRPSPSCDVEGTGLLQDACCAAMVGACGVRPGVCRRPSCVGLSGATGQGGIEGARGDGPAFSH